MGRGGTAGGTEASPSKPRDPKMQSARVKLLDGTFKEFELHRGSEGDSLFQMVCSDLSIEEKDYFSLCFYDKDELRHWLYNDKKILRQLKGLPWEFSYEVKFYPLNPSSLNDDHARYNMFLQLKNDILSERLPATLPTQAMLGALVVQAKYGDADNSAEYEKYLKESHVAPNMTPQLMEQIKELHKETKGQTSAEAECNYLDHCKQLSKYGVLLYSAKDDHNQAVDVGICATGINIYQEAIRIHRFHWQSINKISFRRNTFSVKLNAGEIGKKETTLTFKVHDYAMAKRVWKCGVEHHTFFRLIQPDDKNKTGLFRFGSTKFRYQGRTQFQSKMASQMFDSSATNTVQRQSRLTQSCEEVGKPISVHQTTDLAYTSNELELQPMPRTEQSYEISSSQQKRTTQTKVGNVMKAMDDDDDLVYTPAESPYSAAYYISGSTSSTRSPISFDTTSPHGSQIQQQRLEQQPILRASGARRNLFGRTSTTSDTVRLVSFHEPLDYSSFLPTIRLSAEISHIPINDTVQLYHKGYYSNAPSVSQHGTAQSSPANFQGYPEMRVVQQINGFGQHNELSLEEDAPQHPIRFFVDVNHSGQSSSQKFHRLVHEGKEEVTEPLVPCTLPLYHNKVTIRLDKNEELTTFNIRQFCKIYNNNIASSSSPSALNRSILQDEPAPIRLITKVRKQSQATNTSSSSSSQQQIKQTEHSRKEITNPGTTSTTEPVEERRFLYIARVRHEGEEEFVDKTDVKPESYGVASTSYDGPLEETAREEDLDHAPIHDHASLYHPGHSLLTETSTLTNSEVIDDKKKKKAILHLKSSQKVENVPAESEEKKVLLIARIPHDENEEPLPIREKTAKPSRESQGSGRFGFWKSPGKKSKTVSESSDYPTTDKYEGLLDSVNRQNDLESLPLESHLPEVAYAPKTQTVVIETTSTTEPAEERRFLYIARARHEGEEEFVDKTDVKPESYGVASTSYDGLLEETAREEDLDHAPIHDHASLYHPGHSLLTETSTLTKSEVIDDKKKKKAILHLKSSQKVENVPAESEKKKVLLIARIPHDENEGPLPIREKTAKPSRESQGSGRFSFWKSPGKKSKTVSESSDYQTTDKYEGLLDSVKRQNDLKLLPLESHLPEVAYAPKTQTVVIETTSTTEPAEGRRFLYIARVCHEGEEEFVDKTDVKPESYGVASTSYDGPLEETAREEDLNHAPIYDHASLYHPGHSLLTETSTLTKSEVIDDKKKKKAILHLKSSQKVENVPAESENKKVLLIARIPHGENEEPPPIREKTAKPSRESQGSGRFGFWKSPGKKLKTVSESSDYPTTDKYEGLLDSVNRQNDLESLPLEFHLPEVAYAPKTQTVVIETTSTTEPAEERRFLYIARVRHEGEEEFVDKTDLKPESYGVASTSYDGPLEETAREEDLDHAPIHDHASLYHPGHSLLTETSTLTKSEVIDDKKKKKAILHLKSNQKVENVPAESEEKKVLLIARIPHDENEEPLPIREKTAKPSRESQGSGRFGFWKSPGKKSKTVGESSDYPTTNKYEGLLDSVNRQNDLESLPLESHLPEVAYAPKTQTVVIKTTSTTEPAEERRFLYIARVRHEGEEEFVDKTDVKPESYGVASTSYDGPLEETAREEDLDHAPIHDHASLYHPGHSLLTETSTLTKSEVIDDKKKKKAILHLKSNQKVENVPAESEEKKVLLIARIPHDENEEPLPIREKTAKPSRESQGSGRFGFWKSPGKKSKTVGESSNYPTTNKYEGLLDSVNRQNDLESLPLESHLPEVAYAPKTQTVVIETTSTTEPAEGRRFLYIARVRHEGEEEFVDKTDVKPESYGVASTSYDGPLEETAREEDLDHAPIYDHASLYHPGHSLLTETSTLTKSEVIDDKKKKKAILHLKSNQKVENVPAESEEKKVLLIARISHDENEEPLPIREKTAKPSRESQGSGRFGFWKSPGKKSKTVGESSDYPTTNKYEGLLDSVNRQNDLESLPLESHLPEVAYASKTQTVVIETTSTTEPAEERRFLYIARVRHEGEEEFVDKTDVKPESYGVASTSYDGPLEETAREEDLDHAPIHDHASLYHPGHSLLTETSSLTKSEVIDDKKKKKAILHLKSNQKVENVPAESEEKKVLLIARIPHDENEEPLPIREKTAKPSRESQGSGRFGFWKSPGKKSKTVGESSDYPTTNKYEGLLDSVNRQNDLESLPLESHLKEVAYAPKTQTVVIETTSTTEPAKERRFLYIARVRHEGEEEFVDKTDVKPESYGVASTSYDGPLEETAREEDLDHAPIHDHASLYHPGHSLLTETSTLTKSEVIDDKKKKKAILHLKSSQKVENVPAESENKKVLLIARIPHGENEEPLPIREKTAKPSRESQGSGRFGFWKSPGKKSKTVSESSDYPTTDKYEGLLDSVNRQNDLESLPLESHLPEVAYAPKTQTVVIETTSTTEPAEERRFLYIARVRHEGEEEFVDKTDVKPESYGVASTSYDGPLEETAREEDLDHAPIHDHASLYHPGHSLLTETSTLTKSEVIDDKKKKKAILHLKSNQKVENVPAESEEKKVLLIARIPHDENEEPLPIREKTAKPSRESQGSGRFGFWKSPGKKSKTVSESSDYPTTDKYEGLLDSVNRQNDLESLPLESHLPEVAYAPKTQTVVIETTSTTEPAEERRFLYIARVRHEGEEEFVDKTDVKPESYGVASTSYDGPLEETAREEDLDHAPIHDHASLYHPGHSLLTETSTLNKSEVIDDKKNKKAILHLKSSQKVENVPAESEEKKVLLIARSPHDENVEPLPIREKTAKPSRESQGSGRFGFWKSPGKKSKTVSESSDYPTTDKYEGLLDSVNRQNDLESLPLESHLPEVAYAPKTQTVVIETTSTTEPAEERRFLYIARVRHEGEEEFVDKTDVKPESYGVASTSYDGPLEETAREEDLDHAPIHDHASLYHPGHSLLTETSTLNKSEVMDDKKNKKAILHLKSSQKVENVPAESEEKKVLLIARIPHDENVEPLLIREKTAKPSRESQGSGRFGFWKSPGKKSKTVSESSDYPTTDKYERLLDSVNRQNDLESLPLESHLPEVAYAPKTQTVVIETTSTTEPAEERRFLYIARVCHEGEEEFVDKTDVKPESYGVASTSYDGPLEETAREEDLDHAPIHDHASLYHPGHSLLTETSTLTKIEVIDDKKKKKAILHLKSSQKVENVPAESEEKKVLFIARIPHDENEEPLPIREKTAKPSRESQGSGRFGFWKSPGKKSKTVSESSDYPTTDKYEGLLDSVNRQNDFESLPLESHLPEVAYAPKTQTIVIETTSTTEPAEERRFLYIARVRHEGEEEFVDKTDVKPESYGVASTSYDGPLEETAREEDLNHAPIHDHASLYHPGHSLLTETSMLTKIGVIDDKKKKKAILHLKSSQKVENVPAESEEKKVLLIARIPHDENEEPLPIREKTAKPSRESQGSGRFGFWKSPGKKSKTVSESSDYPTTNKYDGLLDSVNRQNDLESLPLESHLPEVAYAPKTQTVVIETTSTTEPAEERRFLYIARVRHEGEEEFVDKTDVKPESYGVASTSYDGPLEETAREEDLDHAPIHDHASLYHPGHSLLTETSTLTKTEVIDDKKKKKAILLLKSGQKVKNVPAESEEKKVLLIARIPHDENEEPLPIREKTAKPSRESQGSGRFGFWKSPGKKSKTFSESSDYPTTDKYEGLLDSVNRQNDLESLPLESHLPEVAYAPKTQTVVIETTSTTEPAEERRFLYIARVRHEGEEEVVDKTDVKPESYGVASTSYDGPLEETAREEDLDHAPIHDHASLYHPGHSLLTETSTLNKSEVIDDKKKKKAILHLKSSQKVENVPAESEEKKVLLIARIPHEENEEPLPIREKTAKPSRESQGSGRFGFWKSPGKKSKTVSESSDYPTTDKYEGLLDDSVNRQNDLESLPLESHLPEVAYAPKTQTVVIETTSTTEPAEERRFLYIARVRHEGEEEFVDKTDVKPESYGVASTSYDGPLEETAREEDLDHAPIHDHASLYHPGHSLLTETSTLTKSEVIDDKKKKKAILHLKSSQKVENVPAESEEKKVLLIARIPHDENEEPLPIREKTAKPSRESQGSGRFGLWKSPGKKSKTVSESSDYPTTNKYEGLLDSVNRQNDLESLPLESHLPEVAYAPKTQTVIIETTSTTEPVEERRFLYIARVRHEGEEEFVDKTDVKPESYGVASTSYDGPLEETAREEDLDHAPIHDHASLYHPGHSLLTETSTLTKIEVIDDKKKKKAILHLKSSQKVENVPAESEEKKVLLIARIPHDENEEPLPIREKTAKPSRESQGSGRFGFWKSSGKKSKTVSESSDYPTTDKYEGLLDSVNRQNDLESLPLKSHLPEVAYAPKTQTVVIETTSTTEPAEERRFLYIARVRHEGEEEFVDKTDVKPESYGVASTSYDGPLEETAREEDLDHAPIHDHASLYHPGHSLLTETSTLNKSEVIDDKKKKKAILHLKSSQKVENVPAESEEKKVLLIARISHEENEEPLPIREKTAKPSRESQGSGRLGFWKSPGKKSKTVSESSDYPTTDKYEGLLDDSVNRQNDLESLPLESHLPEVAYAPKTQTGVIETTTHTLSNNETDHKYTSSYYHKEGTTVDGQQWIEVRVERRVEVQLDPVYCLSGAGLGAVSEDAAGIIFTSTPPPMPSSVSSFFGRFGFKSKKSKKSKGVKETDSSDSSSSEDEHRHVVTAVVGNDEYELLGKKEPSLDDLKAASLEDLRLQQHTPIVPDAAVLPVLAQKVSCEETGPEQPLKTVSSWQETSILPDDVTIEYDEHGNKITRTVKTSKVKHTVQKQTVQSYMVPDENTPGVVSVEHSRDVMTPVGVTGKGPILETHSRSVVYEGQPISTDNEDMGEFVSSKTITTGNRTVETVTYKREKNGIIETHVEHRVTIHSNTDIDHDAELSAAITEATQMNPDMIVEKIEVRQETSN